jgi:DEAD/DEAH box helicase domain-containing protein
MHTTAFWITLNRRLVDALPFAVSDRQDGLFGLLYAFESVASLLLMCDRMDLGATIGEGSPDIEELPFEPGSRNAEFFEPTLYLYDAYPGGIGLSEPLFHLQESLVGKTRELIAGCTCEKGCPSCVGPAGETGARAKEVALAILEKLAIRDSRIES